MRVLLANPRGFCAGVAMAVEVVERLTNVLNEPIYVYHDIVHNRHVVNRFEAKGVVFTEAIETIPEGSVLVFSAHGVSPEVRSKAKGRNLRAVDATCPLVTKVHGEAIRYAKAGLDILLIGHADHQEVIGTRGEAPGEIRVIESEADAEAIEVDDPTKVVYLTQTTLSTDDAGRIITILKRRFPEIKALLARIFATPRPIVKAWSLSLPATLTVCWSSAPRTPQTQSVSLKLLKIAAPKPCASMMFVKLTPNF